MTVDIDVSEDQATGNAPVKQLSSTEMNPHTGQSSSNNTILHDAKIDELSFGEGGTYEAPKSESINEVSLSILGHICTICVQCSLWSNLYISFSL